MKAEQILKRIGYDNDSITTTEKWIAETVYKLAMEDAAALRQPPVSGSLKDRLFELANDFAVSKQGEVAVKLHSIHNGLQ